MKPAPANLRNDRRDLIVMAGLDPAILGQGLAVGIPSNLEQRIWQHREAVVEEFTKRYNLKRVVYVEPHEEISSAIQREKNSQHWPGA